MTYYLKYKLKNEAPLRISDDSIAQKGQTGTLHYIPGSVMRGYVITNLLNKGYCDDKEELFTDVRFLNAYPFDSDEWLLPSPMGFYEDKTESEGKKPLVSVVVDGKDIEGLKRARLGEFCCIKGDTIKVFSETVRAKGELKKRMYGNEMYRNEYIDCGYTFAGAIASEDRALLDKIKETIGKEVVLGGGRSQGMGRCRVVEVTLDEMRPYDDMIPNKEIMQECYMMLLSPASMCDEEGNPVGLDIPSLEKMMGVKDLRIGYCATSMRTIQGYNRTWHGAIPSVTMYDKGSVFHLQFAGSLSLDRMRVIMDRGIGERLYDGFGRMVFLRDYEAWKFKERTEGLISAKTHTRHEATDDAVLKSVARKYYRNQIKDAMERYIVSHPLEKGMLRSSKTRAIEPILTMNRFNYKKAVELLGMYFGHESGKEAAQKIHKELRSSGTIAAHVNTVLKSDLEELLGMPTKEKKVIMTIPKDELLSEDEKGELKLLFLLKELGFDSRNEVTKR